MPPPVRPQAFGRYELQSRISIGGMAEVFRATYLPTNTQVALKRILPEAAEDEEFIKMFEDEARIASSLEHPYIARCLDFGHVDGDWYIAFEYVDGKDLRALFDRCVRIGEPPPLWFLLYVFSHIAEGLAYAHARKDSSGKPVSIVHRDISPQNIIVSFEGDVKLIDFGIAKAAGKLSRTQVGTIKGKFGYMAPEQVKGVDVDQRTDIFSLGICLWEMLTLKRLFQADNELLVIEKVRHLQVQAPSAMGAQCPPELDRIVLKALAKAPDERYRAGQDVYRDLNHVAAALGVTTRDQIAQYMQRAFPGARPVPAGTDGNMNARQGREMGAMATQNEKGGSDLDIFEGLGKKGVSGPPVPSRPPPPPSSSRSAPPPPPPANKRTLVGVTAPTPPPPLGAVPPPSGPASRQPPPPPGRSNLPPVVAPPPRAMSAVPAPAPPPASGRPTPAPFSTAPAPAPPPVSANASATAPAQPVDMDWDDEDEATQIFDKGDEPTKAEAVPLPAAGSPPPKAKATLLGLTAPQPQAAPPPPSPWGHSPSAPPPPPPHSAAFARASGAPSAAPGPAAFPPPPTIQPLPPPPQTQQGLGPVNRSAPPPPVGHNPYMPLPAPAPLPRAGSAPDAHGPPMMRSMEATAVLLPQPNRTGLWVGLAVAGVAIIGVLVFLLMPHTGRIVINVADAKSGSVNRVDIFVDGRKTPCETAPCVVDQVSSGTHEVKVLAEGYDAPAPQTVSVESRKDAVASFTLASSSKGQGLKVTGSQPGVKLYVDDKEIGPLPQEVKDLAPGDHTVKLAGSERYQPLEKHVSVEKDTVQDLGSISLKVLKGKATISLGTPGARVYLVSGSDRRELPMLPISVDIDTTKAWSLQATKTGYNDYNQPITFEDGQAERAYTINLDPKSAATSAPVAGNYSPAPSPAPAPAPAPVAAAAAPDTGGGDAFLNLNSIPPSTCFVDGRQVGQTPRGGFKVKPGTHTVKFVNADQGLTKTITVTVGAGETKPAVARLQ